MARIIAYPSASQLSSDDCLLGTQKDQSGVNQTNPTKNFSLGGVGKFITDNYAAKRIVSYYQWQNSAPFEYFNIPSSVDTNIPFNTSFNIISQTEGNIFPQLIESGATTPGDPVNPGGNADNRFTFSKEIYGWWLFTFKAHFFDQTGNLEFNGGVRNRTGGATTYLKMLFDEKANASDPNDTIYTGVSLIKINDVCNEIDFVVNSVPNPLGADPFPSATGNAPTEVIMQWQAPE